LPTKLQFIEAIAGRTVRRRKPMLFPPFRIKYNLLRPRWRGMEKMDGKRDGEEVGSGGKI